ncbi:hypothetical protein V8G54_001378 [Vigna mungo]|uniref:Small ribosomal subunit protein uS2c n=1 Tax=Vigna mungo TaxID=3915 RepID=A0AAQ3SBR4_VIGMU
MEVTYKGDIRVRQARVQALKREFKHMEMDEKERVTEFIALSAKDEKILRNMIDDFKSIVVTIEETKDLSTLTVDKILKAKVLKAKDEQAEDEVVVAEVILKMTVKSKPVNIIGVVEDKRKAVEIGQNKHNHYTNECKSRKCYNFGKTGHIVNYCQVETNGETNLLTEGAEEKCEIFLMTKSSDGESVDMESSILTMDEVARLLDEANEIVNKQRIELKELKKAFVDKEEEVSSILEDEDENGKEEDKDVENNQSMRSSDIEIAKNLMSKILDEMKMSANVPKRSVKIVEKSPKVVDSGTRFLVRIFYFLEVDLLAYLMLQSSCRRAPFLLGPQRQNKGLAEPRSLTQTSSTVLSVPNFSTSQSLKLILLNTVVPCTRTSPLYAYVSHVRARFPCTRQDGEEVWEEMIANDVDHCEWSCSSKLMGLVKNKRVSESVELFNKIKEEYVMRDFFCINAIIKGFVNDESLDGAKEWFNEIGKFGLHPHKTTYDILVPFLCKKGDLKTSIEMCYKIFHTQCLVNSWILELVVDKLFHESMNKDAMEIVDGEEVWEEMVANGVDHCEWSCSSKLMGLVKNKRVSEACLADAKRWWLRSGRDSDECTPFENKSTWIQLFKDRKVKELKFYLEETEWKLKLPFLINSILERYEDLKKALGILFDIEFFKYIIGREEEIESLAFNIKEIGKVSTEGEVYLYGRDSPLRGEFREKKKERRRTRRSVQGRSVHGRSTGRFQSFPKKDAALLKRQLAQLETYLGDIQYMKGLPDIEIIIDQQEEYTALRECITLEIPTICLIDTNSDSDLADISIPANDDAIASIRLILNKLVFAICEGREKRTREQGRRVQIHGASPAPSGGGCAAAENPMNARLPRISPNGFNYSRIERNGMEVEITVLSQLYSREVRGLQESSQNFLVGKASTDGEVYLYGRDSPLREEFREKKRREGRTHYANLNTVKNTHYDNWSAVKKTHYEDAYKGDAYKFSI